MVEEKIMKQKIKMIISIIEKAGTPVPISRIQNELYQKKTKKTDGGEQKYGMSFYQLRDTLTRLASEGQITSQQLGRVVYYGKKA